MARARFNQYFIPLVMLAGASAFVVPPRAGQGLRSRVDGLFTPVSYPVRELAGVVSRRWHAGEGAPEQGAGVPADAQRQIEQLQNQVASLSMQIEVLAELAAARELRGDAQKYARPFRVSGADASGRDWLLLAAGSGEGLAAGQAVVRRDGLVGKVVSAGSGGGSVRLITDRGMRLGAQIGRMRPSADGVRMEFQIARTPPPLVEGRGNGRLAISNLTMAQAEEAGIAPGDLVVLRDPEDWPVVVNGFVIGQVELVERQPRASLFADIWVRPRLNLLQLNEVMVVVGAAPAARAGR
jgi:cell shape-determining protein MreC